MITLRKPRSNTYPWCPSVRAYKCRKHALALALPVYEPRPSSAQDSVVEQSKLWTSLASVKR